MDAWFYVTEGRTEGPLPLEELRRRLAMGIVTPATLVWEPSLPGWRPAQAVEILRLPAFGGPPAGTAPAPAGIPPFPMHTISQAPAVSAPTAQDAGHGGSEALPAPLPAPGAFDGVATRADASGVVAAVQSAAPHRKGQKPRSRLGALFATLFAVALVGLAVLAVLRIPGLKDRLTGMVAEVREKLTSSAEPAASQSATGQTAPVVVPPLADPAGLGPGPSPDPAANESSAPAGSSAPYRCPLDVMNAEWQAPRKLGSFERTDLTIGEPSAEKQWAYFYTCLYRHPTLGTVGHKVLTFEKYRGDVLAAEYTRAAVDELKPRRHVIHQEDVIAPKVGGRLGRIFVLRSKSGSDIIWHNGRHFLHIEAPTTQLALEFKKQLAY